MIYADIFADALVQSKYHQYRIELKLINSYADIASPRRLRRLTHDDMKSTSSSLRPACNIPHVHSWRARHC